MKDFKKILSVFALTTFVIIALGFSASNANAACELDTAASYGLCIAYCEAMDCSGVPIHPTGCDKVNDRYKLMNNDFNISCVDVGSCDGMCVPIQEECCDGECVDFGACNQQP